MKKVLIVDDLKTILITLESILKKEGYFVSACLNAMDAIDRFNSEHFDLVITDAVMPVGGSGYSLISTIRSGNRNQDVPIVMLTGKREKADIEKAISLGASDYIVKPIDPDILMSKVRHILNKSEENKPEFIHAAVRSEANIHFKTEIVSISESELIINTNIQLDPGQLYRISSDFFKQFEIQFVNIRVIECSQIQDKPSHLYQVKAQFVGLSDKELSKIRLWIRKRLIENDSV